MCVYHVEFSKLTYLYILVFTPAGCFWQVELEDALSCDDEVLEEVFEHVDPPLSTVIRIPQMFVAKLRYQLGWFLQQVFDYGIPVFYWAHHQFADVVRKRYLLR